MVRSCVAGTQTPWTQLTGLQTAAAQSGGAHPSAQLQWYPPAIVAAASGSSASASATAPAACWARSETHTPCPLHSTPSSSQKNASVVTRKPSERWLVRCLDVSVRRPPRTASSTPMRTTGASVMVDQALEVSTRLQLRPLSVDHTAPPAGEPPAKNKRLAAATRDAPARGAHPATVGVTVSHETPSVVAYTSPSVAAKSEPPATKSCPRNVAQAARPRRDHRALGRVSHASPERSLDAKTPCVGEKSNPPSSHSLLPCAAPQAALRGDHLTCASDTSVQFRPADEDRHTSALRRLKPPAVEMPPIRNTLVSVRMTVAPCRGPKGATPVSNAQRLSTNLHTSGLSPVAVLPPMATAVVPFEAAWMAARGVQGACRWSHEGVLPWLGQLKRSRTSSPRTAGIPPPLLLRPSQPLRASPDAAGLHSAS
mmetsp:Transcript_10119/g.39415  ORF Transcript_10119/g.39415 Transcript_10119/m.39415 type:complete len:426 (+) Transcript_10119:1039-2316(+)